MKLSSLTLSNYRGFGEARKSGSDYVQAAIEILFESDVTIIAGVNGSGKSGILRAISGLASYLAPEISQAKRDIIPFSDDDIHHGKQAFTISSRFKGCVIETAAQIVRARPDPERAPEIRKEIEDLRVNRRYLKKDSKEDKKVGARIEFLEHLLTDSEDTFTYQTGKIENAGKLNESPELLMVYYSTNRVFGSLPPRRADVRPISVADAYLNALSEGRISLNDFANWYRAVQEGMVGGKKFGKSLLAMTEHSIGTILPGFSGLALEEAPRPHFTIKKEANRFNLNQLSDGERALLALAFDLTRRLTIANPDSKSPVTEGKALVMIDEVDLHLHPKWQRDVVRRLLNAFPACQFIVTTHSPQVLGEVKAEKIRILDDGSVRQPSVSFADSNWILEHVLRGGAKERNAEVKALLDKAEVQMGRGHLRAAKISLTAARKRMGGEDGELVRLESGLETLESLADEDD